jgi:hypothetical protein
MYMPIPMPTPAATAATVVDAIRAVDASFIVPAPPRVWLSDYYLAFLSFARPAQLTRTLVLRTPAMNKKQIQLKKKEKERKDGAGVKSATSKESLAKQAKDASAYICQSCRQTFMVTSKSKQLIEHCDGKHPKLPREQCFPELQDMIAREAAGGGKK